VTLAASTCRNWAIVLRASWGDCVGAHASTFPPFYRDLERHRFSLIISDPLHLPIKDSEFGFSEENNAWVKWVAAPILCYYEPLITLQEFKIELLVPLPSVSPDCMLPDY
jgi:hypothetical protein